MFKCFLSMSLFLMTVLLSNSVCAEQYNKNLIYKEKRIGAVKQITKIEKKPILKKQKEVKKEKPSFQMKFVPSQRTTGIDGGEFLSKIKSKKAYGRKLRDDNAKNIISQMEDNGIKLTKEQKEKLLENPKSAKEIIWELGNNVEQSQKNLKISSQEDIKKLKEQSDKNIKKNIKMIEVRTGMEYQDMVDQTMSVYDKEKTAKSDNE